MVLTQFHRVTIDTKSASVTSRARLAPFPARDRVERARKRRHTFYSTYPHARPPTHALAPSPAPTIVYRVAIPANPQTRRNPAPLFDTYLDRDRRAFQIRVRERVVFNVYVIVARERVHTLRRPSDAGDELARGRGVGG